MFALLLVGMACTFDMVSHVQQSVRRVAKHTMKEFQEVSELSFKHLTKRKDMVVFQDGHSLLH